MLYYVVTPDLESALSRLGDLMEREDNVVVFCGDRYTLLVEETICKRLGGTFSAEVLTFARYLKTYASDRMLSKQGSVMAIRRLLSEYRGQLTCFRGAHTGDAALGIYDTLIRLSASRITPAMLNDVDLSDQPVLQGKISDLAFLQEKYELFLANNRYMDESNYFRLLPDVIRREQSFEGKHLVLFGFPSFAAQMREGIEACVESAGNVTAFFIGGREEIYRNEAEANFLDLVGDRPVRAQRFALPAIEEVLRIRAGLYRPEIFGESPMRTDRVSLFEARGKREETERVAVEIARRVREGKRYRDEVVLVPDLSEYALTIRRVFDEHGIPYFIDLKKSMKEHPLGQFLLAALEMTADGLSPESVQSFASNVYFGKSDNYRNYLSEFAAFRGGCKREIKETENYTKGEMVFFRERLLSFLLPARAEGQEYVALLRNMLDHTERTTEDLAKLYDDPYDQDYIRRGAEKIEKVLSEAEALTNGYFMDASEMATVLGDGLAALEVSMIPLKSDAVFVGDFAESKFLPVPDLYVLGMTERVPKAADDTALLADKEIDLLGKVKLSIEPTVAQSNLRVRESASLNLCSFRERLTCFVPLDSDGGRSEMLSYLSRLFSRTGATGLSMERAEEYDLSLLAYAATTKELALKQLLLKKIDADGGMQTEGMGALYRALQKKGAQERTDALYQGVEKAPYLSCGEKLFFGREGGTVSPTLLETYFSCPYRNFLSLGLRLRENKEGGMANTDTGNFVHAVMEKLAGEMKEGKIPSYEQCEERVRAIAGELLRVPPYAYMQDTAGGKYAMDALVEETVKIGRAMYRTVAQSAFEVTDSEKAIVFGEKTKLYGKVDRVDETDGFVRVVDYKTGSVDSSPQSYYVGKKLQLQLYLAAVSRNKTPAGAFYFPAHYDYTTEGGSNFAMTGFFNEAGLSLADTEAEGGKSELFDVSLSSRSDKVMTGEQFSDFVDYALLLAEQGGAELKKGFIGACPYGKCPSWCKYKGLCGSEGDRVRRDETITCADIAEIARREKEDKT